MNIFYLDPNPVKCAEYHCDKHVVKMILETTQLLCSAHYLHPNGEYKPVYRLTHKNHPSAVWVRQSLANYLWLCNLGLELCSEYRKRYKKIHKCESYINTLSFSLPAIAHGVFTEPPKCMPDNCKGNDTVQSYKNYYVREKSYMAKWDYSDTPQWYIEGLHNLTLQTV